MRLFRLLFLFPFEGLRTGKILGVTVSRNPILWIPYLILTPIVLIGFAFLALVIYPVFILASIIALQFFDRTHFTFSHEGLIFDHAFPRRRIPWDHIRQVVECREPHSIFYRILLDIETAPADGLIAVTGNFEEFESALISRKIPLRRQDLTDPESPANPTDQPRL